MLFTDGLFEVEDKSGNQFTEDELRAAVSRHSSIAPQEFFHPRIGGSASVFSERIVR
jgi:serine phosphatase RsbU (regulator of sigma subunit)